MNPKAKLSEQHHKEIAQQKLAARIAMLETKGTNPKEIGRDAMIRKLKAEVRRVDRRLKENAISEGKTAENLKRKAEKAAAEKLERETGGAKNRKKRAVGPRKEKKPRVRVEEDTDE